MNRIHTILLLTLLPLLAHAQSTSPNPSILQLTQYQFDSDTCCWRLLSCNKQFAEAASLLTTYLRHSPNAKRKMPLRFHAGQMHALDNNYPEAIHLINKTFSLFHKFLGDEDGRMWYYYAKGLVAFLKDDEKTLQHIVQHWERKFPRKKNYEQLKAMHDAPDGKSYFEVIKEYRQNKRLH